MHIYTIIVCMYVCVCERLKVSHAPQCGVRAVLVKEKASGAKPGEEPQQYIEVRVCVWVCVVLMDWQLCTKLFVILRMVT